MNISVIVISYNTKKLLEDCLNSIFKFTKGIKFEVVVVDNASNDGSREMLKKKYPKTKLILNKKNLGFGTANNQGMKIARGDYILLLNSDTYLIENSLKKLVDKAKSVSNLGALAPQLLNENRTIQQSAGFFPNLPQIFYWMSFLDDLPGGTYLKPYHIDHDSFYKSEQKVDWVTAATILVPRTTINKVGSFDEKIFMYGEEIEWCYRIKKAGLEVYFSPSTKIIHIGQGSSKKIPKAAFIGEYNGLIYFYSKHRGALALQIARSFLKMGALARVLVFALLGRKELARTYVEVFKVA